MILHGIIHGDEHLAMINDTASVTLVAQQAVLKLYPQVMVATPVPVGISPHWMDRKGTPTLENLVTDLMGRNQPKVILNLARVDYIDRTGIGTITLCFSNMKKSDGALRIAGAGGKVRQQFKMTRLDTVLTFYPTVEEACRTWLQPCP